MTAESQSGYVGVILSCYMLRGRYEITKSLLADESVRAAIVALDREVALLKQENACLRATLENDKTGRQTLEQRLVEAEGQLVSVRIQLEDERGESRRLRNEVSDPTSSNHM